MAAAPGGRVGLRRPRSATAALQAPGRGPATPAQLGTAGAGVARPAGRCRRATAHLRVPRAARRLPPERADGETRRPGPAAGLRAAAERAPTKWSRPGPAPRRCTRVAAAPVHRSAPLPAPVPAGGQRGGRRGSPPAPAGLGLPPAIVRRAPRAGPAPPPRSPAALPRTGGPGRRPPRGCRAEPCEPCRASPAGERRRVPAAWLSSPGSAAPGQSRSRPPSRRRAARTGPAPARSAGTGRHRRPPNRPAAGGGSVATSDAGRGLRRQPRGSGRRAAPPPHRHGWADTGRGAAGAARGCGTGAVLPGPRGGQGRAAAPRGAAAGLDAALPGRTRSPRPPLPFVSPPPPVPGPAVREPPALLAPRSPRRAGPRSSRSAHPDRERPLPGPRCPAGAAERGEPGPPSGHVPAWFPPVSPWSVGTWHSTSQRDTGVQGLYRLGSNVQAALGTSSHVHIALSQWGPAAIHLQLCGYRRREEQGSGGGMPSDALPICCVTSARATASARRKGPAPARLFRQRNREMAPRPLPPAPARMCGTAGSVAGSAAAGLCLRAAAGSAGGCGLPAAGFALSPPPRDRAHPQPSPAPSVRRSSAAGGHGAARHCGLPLQASVPAHSPHGAPTGTAQCPRSRRECASPAPAMAAPRRRRDDAEGTAAPHRGLLPAPPEGDEGVTAGRRGAPDPSAEGAVAHAGPAGVVGRMGWLRVASGRGCSPRRGPGGARTPGAAPGSCTKGRGRRLEAVAVGLDHGRERGRKG
ncbi:collagen alpha-1(I) chain-like [Corvus moneduloides]|uniref:collagen alpha-1(I) chain-like n=1 Tax=Corvus moneduloides TaxID=1196302 RepID=UPI001364035D|nr:collagen alpha-1(I) chain-like [Corvus moneduloides]